VIKENYNQFKTRLEHGPDEIKEYCVFLRNRVNLETEVLIDQAHQFNEHLTANIDRYEKQCLSSFDYGIGSFIKDNEEFLIRIRNFIEEISELLAKHYIDEQSINASLSRGNAYLDKFKLEEQLLKKIMFDRKLMEFAKSENKLDHNLLGKFYLKQLIYEPVDFKELRFDDKIVTNYHMLFSLFKLENRNNVVFYIDTSFYLNMVSFDNSGIVIKKISNILINHQIDS
jgi:hypothetical protein